MSKPPIAKSKGTASEADKSWLAYAQKEKQETPKRLEDTAKFLVAIISISLTVFISKRPDVLADWTKTTFMGVALIWMASVLSSFLVMFPWRYKFNPDSAEDIRAAFRKISVVKRGFLFLSVALYLLGLMLGIWAFWSGF